MRWPTSGDEHATIHSEPGHRRSTTKPHSLILGLATSFLKDISPYPFSYMVRIVTPRISERERPVRVFHIDPNGFGENATGDFSCITTNHYLNKGLVADSQANDWSLERYRRLDKRITEPVSASEAWASLRAVAVGAESSFPTLHSVVVYPERRSLDLGFATWKNGKIMPAPMRKPHRIKFSRLFKSHKSRRAGRASKSHKKAS